MIKNVRNNLVIHKKIISIQKIKINLIFQKKNAAVFFKMKIFSRFAKKMDKIKVKN